MRFFNDPNFKVFKIKYNSKEPIDKWKDPNKWKNYQGCDYEEGYNYALYLSASNLVALDYDPRNSNDETKKTLNDLKRILDKTYSHKTAGGGDHYLFKVDPTRAYPFKGALCQGIDIKYNGYIVIPPSSIDGNNYEADLFEGKPIIDLPSEIEEMCTGKPIQQRAITDFPQQTITPYRDEMFNYLQIAKDIQSYANKNKIGYEIWKDIGMCFHSILNGSDIGFECFKIVSNNSQYKDSEASLKYKWESFGKNKSKNKYGLPKLREILSHINIELDNYQKVDYIFNLISGTSNMIIPTIDQKPSLDSLKDTLLSKDSIDKKDLLNLLQSISSSGVAPKRVPKLNDFLEKISVKFFNQFVAYIKASKSYAVLENQGTSRETFYLHTTTQFKEAFLPFHIKSSKGSDIYLTDYYIKSPDKKVYTDIVYAPTTNRSDYLTVFPRGSVSIEPTATDYNEKLVKPFLDFLTHNICGIPFDLQGVDDDVIRAKKNLCRYLLWYMAHTLRKPQEAQSVILALWGIQGTGKNMFTSIFGRLFDNPTMFTNITFSNLDSSYTDCYNKKFLCVCNEFPPKLESRVWAKLKAYTGTEDFITMNPKGEKQYNAVIRARFITTSNMYPAFGETSDNRRIIRIQTEKNITDFTEIAKLRDDKEFIHNLAKYLNNIDLKEFQACIVPKDKIMTQEEIQVESLLKREQTKDSDAMHEILLSMLNVQEAPYIINMNTKEYGRIKAIHLDKLFKCINIKFKELNGRLSLEYQTSRQFLAKMIKFYPNPTHPKLLSIPRPFIIDGKSIKLYEYNSFIKYFLGENDILEDEKELDSVEEDI